MTKTFDTSRVGGGTYELALDADGNYNLNSVGFTQVNKLNLPDLKTSAATSVADTTKKATEDTIKKQTTEVFRPSNVYQSGGDGQGANTQSMVNEANVNEAKVNEATVRHAGDAMTTGDGPWTMRSGKADTTPDTTPDTTDAKGWEKIAQSYTLSGDKAPERFSGESNIYKSMVEPPLGETYDTSKVDKYKYARGPQKVNVPSDKYKYARGPQKVNVPKATVSNTALRSVKTASNVLSKALGFVMDNTLIGKALGSIKETDTQKMNKGYFNTNEGSQRISGNPATDLYAGMNRNSDFGNLERAGNKRISTREATAVKKTGTWSKEKLDNFVAKTEKMKGDASKYTASKQKATQGPAGSGGGGSSGSDSGRVICTELHRTDELSTRDWIRDTKFTFKILSRTHVKGYLLWAEPTVKHIQKYPRYRKVWKHIAQHRANDVAWRLNEGKFDLLGRIYAGIGEPLCWVLGNFVGDKQISKYNLTHWRKA